MHRMAQINGRRASAIAVALFCAGLPMTAKAGDWTGMSVGGSIGWSDATGPGLLKGEDSSFGLHIGYDQDFGDVVVGGEIELEYSDLNIGTVTVNSISRVKLRAGYDFGQAVGYVTIGGSHADTSIGNDTGSVFGLGLSYSVNDQFSIGGEYLRQNFDSLTGTSGDTDVDSLSVRASFRF